MKPLLTFIILTFFLDASAQKGQFISRWSNNPGGNPSLTTQDYHSFRKGRLLVYLSNDDSCIYLDMKIPEIADQNHILRTGMTLWICPDGKHHKVNGVRFPTGLRHSGQRGQGPGRYENISNPLEQVKTIELIGFGSDQPQTLSSDNKNNVRGVLWYDKIGDLYYRLTIPLNRLPVTDKSDPAKGGHLTFGIEYTDQQSPANRGGYSGTGERSGDMGGRMGGGMGSGGMSRGGGGGYRGGGMGSGRGGMRGGSFSRSGQGNGSYAHESTINVWVKDIKLATR